MNPSKPANLNKAVESLELAFGEFASIPGSSDSSLLSKVSGKLMEAFALLHETDPGLLSGEMRERVEERVEKGKPRAGRDTFNTGF